MNDNKELLEWAVENREEWNSPYTHIRYDSGSKEIIKTIGTSWHVDNNNQWNYNPIGSNALDDFEVVAEYIIFHVSPQSITKAEWLQAKQQKEDNKDMNGDIDGPIERDKVYNLQVTGEQLFFILLLTGVTNGCWESKSKLMDKVWDMFSLNNRDILLKVPRMENGSLVEIKDHVNNALHYVFHKPSPQEQEYNKLMEKIKELGSTSTEIETIYN